MAMGDDDGDGNGDERGKFLTENADVWSQNAWDHVPPPADQRAIIAASLARQRAAPVPDHDKPNYNTKPAKHWDNFYKTNASNFFKNRKWLPLEFSELVAAADLSAGHRTVVEVGCGAGNAIFPLLAQNQNPELHIHVFDYSSHAIKLVQNNPLYTSPPCGTIAASVWDLSSACPPPSLAPRSADILLLVFVFSALHPSEWPRAISNIAQILKPGGLVLMRDFGRHDLTQLRLKAGRLLEDNFYIRGDSTRVYFFELDELAILFTGSTAPIAQVDVQVNESTKVDEEGKNDGGDDGGGTGRDDEVETEDVGAQDERADIHGLMPSLDQNPASPDNSYDPVPRPDPSSSSSLSSSSTNVIHPSLEDPTTLGLAHPLFTIEQLGVDRRLLVNRKRQLKMHRVWVQGKFRRAEGGGG
ncbi:S-adenosyl-L-methionine-dependent methyltransferase [Multifurca ochricompacta]|uniref:tRNA N(3)-methylcytidine methyltransferase n=1 Tax=Multifurca ochricompacta TaxID=376703 RepID=A0AAD4QR66_9AGAM|nr:S-adenosyl-L-methionine-dependent methyltransferase [Multifurca ochricompacta]